MLHTVDDDATRAKRQLTDNPMTRVASPFTVEGLSPNRILAVDWDDELIATYEAAEGKRRAAEAPEDFKDFAQIILDNLKAEVVQQAHKVDRITFTCLKGWLGKWVVTVGLSSTATSSAARACSGVCHCLHRWCGPPFDDGIAQAEPRAFRDFAAGSADAARN